METDYSLTLTDADGDILIARHTYPGDKVRVSVKNAGHTNVVDLTPFSARRLANHLHSLADESEPRPEADAAPEKAPAKSLLDKARRRCLAAHTLHATASAVESLPAEAKENVILWLAGEADTPEGDQ